MGSKELFCMSRSKLDRHAIVSQVVAGLMTQRRGGEWLGLSTRQIKRLCREFREKGPSGLVCARRGRPSNRALPPELKARVLALKREKYSDFGPTLAQEKLASCDGLVVGRETLRRWLVEEGTWRAKRRKGANHPLREPRSRRGEMVQLDASLHDWLEGRAGPGVKHALLVAIDDATSEVLAAVFARCENAFAYFELLDQLVKSHGCPLQAYTDRHSVFRPTQEAQLKVPAEPQVARGMRELDIELICANSPQAKGRVERFFRTSQDRLVKELRLLGVNDFEAANAALPALIAAHNRRFAKPAFSREDAHRPLTTHQRENLPLVLCERYERVVSQSLTISLESNLLQLHSPHPAYHLRRKTVVVLKRSDGGLEVRRPTAAGFELLRHTSAPSPRKGPVQGQIVSSKELSLGRVAPPQSAVQGSVGETADPNCKAMEQPKPRTSPAASASRPDHRNFSSGGFSAKARSAISRALPGSPRP